MFGQKVEAKVGRVSPRVVVEDGGGVQRITNIPLHITLDDSVAGGLGEVAQDMLKHMRSGVQRNGNISLDALALTGEFSASDSKKMKLDVAGVSASFKAPKKEDSEPKVVVTISMATKQEALWWFVEAQDSSINVKLTKKQTELPV